VSSSTTPSVPIPGRGEILQEGRAKPARAQHQHLGRDQARLAHAADLGQHDMACVPPDLHFRHVGPRHGPFIAWVLLTPMTTTAVPPPVKARPSLTPLLLVVLALLSSFTPLSIDMYLPALPVIAVDLGGTVGDIQLTLSAFMIAFGFGQIFYGPAGDRFGRRPVILGGIAIYVVASIGCAFAPRRAIWCCCASCRACRPAVAWCWPVPWCATSPRRTRRRAPCR
jgi:hypothetical protein